MEYSYIGIGSNQGNSIELIKKALKLINSVNGVKVIRVAPVYRTEPIGYAVQPWFYNTVAEVQVDISPFELLDTLLGIEKALGRVRSVRWGPRTIDLDILLFGEKRIQTPRLTVPHPRMAQRAFVMVPLAHLIPDRVIQGKRVKETAEFLLKEQKIERCPGILLGISPEG